MMLWYRVLIGHEGLLRGHIVQREDSPRTAALARAGFLESLAADEVVVPEQPGTFDLEPEPAKVVKRRGRRGKQAEVGPADGPESQSSSGVVVRDEDDRADGGDGEG